MTFKRQPRYWVCALKGTAWHYLNAQGEVTIAPQKFNETWSNGEPGAWTFDQASKRCHTANCKGGGLTWVLRITGSSFNS